MKDERRDRAFCEIHSSFILHPSSFILLTLLLAALGGACRPSPLTAHRSPLVTFSGPTMGTRFTVKVVEPPASVDAETLKREIDDTLAGIDALMSTYRTDSELSRLNRFDQSGWFAVSPETAAVIDEAVEVGRLTGGAFDVTVAPLVNLWNFGPEKRALDRVPSPAEIEEVMARIGFESLEVRLSPPAIRKKRAGLLIDLSGIAKGFAVDQVAEHLQRRGIRNYMVDIGGEVEARGRNASGKPWQIAIESPVTDRREIHRVLGLDGLAVATSGDYRNYFEEEGIRYCHIIDPRSGRPIAHKLASVSVLGSSCTRADGLATALMVLGPEEGYNLAIEEDLAALLLVKTDSGFVEKATPRFEEVLQR